MSKYSKEYIKQELKNFSMKELQVFKRLVQEFKYPVELAFEKILELKKKREGQRAETKKGRVKETILKNDGGQNIIKPVDSKDFQLIEIKDSMEPIDNSPRTKDLSKEQIIPVLTPEQIEVKSLNEKQRKTYDRFRKNGFNHDDALREAYVEAKKELVEKLKSLEAFYKVDNQT